MPDAHIALRWPNPVDPADFDSAYAAIVGDGVTGQQYTASMAQMLGIASRQIDITSAPYNADQTGSLDATVAIRRALDDAAAASDTGRTDIVFPPGNYKTTEKLSISVGSGEGSVGPLAALRLIGVPGRSFLLPSSAVVGSCMAVKSHTNTDGVSSSFEMNGLGLNGINASAGGIIGLDLGNNPGGTYGNYRLANAIVKRFSGAAGIGLQLRNVVGFDSDHCFYYRNGDNVLVDGGDIDFPTTVLFRKSKMLYGTRKGFKMLQGYGVTLENCTVEANTEQGVFLQTTAAKNIVKFGMRGCWIEGNSAATPTNYQVHIDGSAAGASLSASLRDVFWGGGARSLYMLTAQNVVLSEIYSRATAGSVLLDNVLGQIVDWPQNNVPFNTAVTIQNSPFLTIPDYYSRGFDQPAYGASVVIDCRIGNVHEIGASNGVAFTVANPTNVYSNRVHERVIKIKNISGGVLGAITWGTKYKLAGAFTSPASAQSRSIVFTYDPNTTNWYEVSRSAADVPNV